MRTSVSQPSPDVKAVKRDVADPTRIKVRWWASSPLIGAPSTLRREHLVLMSVSNGKGDPRTTRVATCVNGAVAARVAELLQKAEGI